MALNAPLSAGIAYENEMNTLCLSAGDQLEGINAFREKRAPEFQSLMQAQDSGASGSPARFGATKSP
jgi:hypothetical protein